jgi:hypothetical protein
MVYFQTPFGYILEGLVMEDVCVFYGHLVYLWPIGKFYGTLVHFVVIYSPFWYIAPRNIWQP